MQLLFKPLLRLGISPSIQAAAMWSILESFAGPLFSLILIPVLTHNLGLENYGLYVMVMAFVGLFSFAGLGMSTSVTYLLSVNFDILNNKNIAERIGTAIGITLCGTITLSLLLFITFEIYISNFEKIFPQFISHKPLIYCGLVLLSLTQCEAILSSALKGLQQFKVSSKLELLIRFVNFSVITATAVMFKSILAITICTVLVTFFSLITRYIALRKIAGLKILDIRLNSGYGHELFHFGKWMTLQSVSGALFVSFDKVIIGGLLGSKVVGIYNILSTLTQLVHFVPANMAVFILPKIAKNNKIITLNIFKKIFSLTIICSSLISIILIVLKPFIFLKFSIGSEFDNIFYWLIFSFILLSLNVPSYLIAIALNLVKAVSLQCIVGTILGITSIFFLVSKYGVLGAVVSKIIYALIALSLIIPVLKKIKIVNHNEK